MCAKMLFLGYNGPLSGEQHEEGGVGVAWNLQKLPFFPKYAEIRSRIQPNYLCLAWVAKKSPDPKDWWFKYSFIYLCIIGLLLVLPDKVVYLVTNIASRNSRLGHTTTFVVVTSSNACWCYNLKWCYHWKIHAWIPNCIVEQQQTPSFL